jgi:hypothetical protein
MKCPRLNRYLNRKLFHEETGFLLNYFSLKISDPLIAEELVQHRGSQFKRIVTPMMFFSFFSLISTIYSLYVQKSGNPMMIVTGALTIILMLTL